MDGFGMDVRASEANSNWHMSESVADGCKM